MCTQKPRAPAAGAGPAAAAGHGRIGPRRAASAGVAAVRRRWCAVAARGRAERQAGAVGGQQRRAGARAAPRRWRAVRAVAAAVVGRLRMRRHGWIRPCSHGAAAPCPGFVVAPNGHAPGTRASLAAPAAPAPLLFAKASAAMWSAAERVLAVERMPSGHAKCTSYIRAEHWQTHRLAERLKDSPRTAAKLRHLSEARQGRAPQRWRRRRRRRQRSRRRRRRRHRRRASPPRRRWHARGSCAARRPAPGPRPAGCRRCCPTGNRRRPKRPSPRLRARARAAPLLAASGRGTQGCDSTGGWPPAPQRAALVWAAGRAGRGAQAAERSLHAQGNPGLARRAGSGCSRGRVVGTAQRAAGRAGAAARG